MKITVNNSYFRTITKHMEQFENDGIITNEQRVQIINSYQIKNSPSSMSIASTIGAVLIGVGILLFIAGNWLHISPLFRISILILSLIAMYTAGIKLEDTHPKTAFAFRVIAMFIFGGSIFLTDQTFNLTRSLSELFIIFAFGVFIINLSEDDSIFFYVIYELLLSVVYANLILGAYAHEINGLKLWTVGIIGVVGIIAGIYFFTESALTSWGYNATTLAIGLSIIALLGKLDVPLIILVTSAMIWGILSLLTIPNLISEHFNIHYTRKLSTIPFLFMGISGIILTIPEVYEESFSIYGNGAYSLSIIFSILFFTFLIFLYKKGFAESILFIIAIILRYYFDVFFDFMPRAIFFIIGGLLLMSIGWFLESRRRNNVEINRKNNTNYNMDNTIYQGGTNHENK